MPSWQQHQPFKYMAIPSATVSNKISCHRCGSSICYIAQHQSVKHVVLPSATMAITSAMHIWLSICYHYNIINYLSCGFHQPQWSKSDYTICHNDTNYQPSQLHGNNICQWNQWLHYDNNICHNQHKQVGLPCVNNKNGKNNHIWQTYPNSYCKE